MTAYNILIRDSNPVRCPEVVATLSRLDCQVWQWSGGKITWKGGAAAQNMSVPTRWDLHLDHTGDGDVPDGIKVLDVALTVFYSASGAPNLDFGIPWAVKPGQIPSQDRWGELLKVATMPKEERKDAFDLIWRGIPEALLSWALLEFYGGNEESANQIKNQVEGAAMAEMRQRSEDFSADLTFERAKEFISSMRHDW